MSTFGAYHLADNPSMYQPVRSNNYRFNVVGLDRILKAGENPELESSYITNAREVLDFSVVSFAAPHFSQEPISINRGNSTVKYAGKVNWEGTSNLVINDFVGADGKSVLMAWQNLSYDVINDTIPSSVNYKVDAQVLEYTADNQLIRYWDLKGCWVSNISESEYSYDSADKRQVTATIQYDRAIPHLAD